MSTGEGVLLVSASMGAGHGRAAEAVREAMLRDEPGRPVEHVDLLELAPRWVAAVIGPGYEMVATRTPRVWGRVYRHTDSRGPELARWGPVAHRVLFREFRRLLGSGRWGACVCTHFLPGQLAAGLPGLPPFAMVVTDLTLHHVWAQRRVELYFVGVESLAAELRPRVREARVEVTGIPVAERFAHAPPPLEARAALGLDPGRIVAVVMGGGLGIGVAEAAQAACMADGVQVVAICGRNSAAALRLRALRLPRERLRVLGYVSGVEHYLAAADVVITKPGGLTVSEALALGKPLLLTTGIPGQEEGNARVLCEAGAAWDAPHPAALPHHLARLRADAPSLLRLSAAARALGRPHAAAHIAREVRENLLHRAAA